MQGFFLGGAVLMLAFTMIYCALQVASARYRMAARTAVNEPPTRMTICNVCRQRKLCSWVRVGIGNVWLCAWCRRDR